MKKSFIILIHFLIVILSWTSWLWLKWDVIALVSLIHIAMQEIFNMKVIDIFG